MGVFTSALITDVDDPTVWTLPALRVLGPAVKKAIHSLQPRPTAGLPPNPDRFVGTYDNGVRIRLDPVKHLLIASGLDRSNLTLSYEPSLGFDNLRATPLSPQDCRHLDDGANLEIVYFSFDGASAKASALEFMGGSYNQQHQA